MTGGGIKLRLANIEARYTSKYNCSDPDGMWNEAKAKLGFTSALPANTTVLITLPKDVYKNPASKCNMGLATLEANPNSRAT